MNFYLGTHKTGWLWRETPPLFISRRQLAARSVRNLRPARGRWALDSGGFSELKDFGGWTLSPADYIHLVRLWARRIGGLDWAAPQDWMCEPEQLLRTGLSVLEHQRRTVANLVTLRDMAPDLPFIPVLQGQDIEDYLRCVQMYGEAGVDLVREPLVGLGSVCRRQSTPEIGEIVHELRRHDLTLHGFGVKSLGLKAYGSYLYSADSLAWSFRARRGDPMPQCVHSSCQNCIVFALDWRSRLLDNLAAQGIEVIDYDQAAA